MSGELLPNSEIILYQTEDGRTRVQCRFENETLWLTQALISELFETTPQNVTLHLKAIFAEGELVEAATCKDYLQVRLEGEREVSRKLRHYRLEAILAVGFRVRSHRGTQFRQWATARLTAYIEFAELRALQRKVMTMRDWISGELQEKAVCRDFRHTADDGKDYTTRFYNLDAIIAAGFRVNSARAIQFRQWATGVLRDFAIRGYVLDKERLKNGAFLSKEYYDNLLAEIREIRASERRFYQKITDIYATAMDYDVKAETTQTFFATVQNKLHFALHGHTAAELTRSALGISDLGKNQQRRLRCRPLSC